MLKITDKDIIELPQFLQETSKYNNIGLTGPVRGHCNYC